MNKNLLPLDTVKSRMERERIKREGFGLSLGESITIFVFVAMIAICILG